MSPNNSTTQPEANLIPMTALVVGVISAAFFFILAAHVAVKIYRSRRQEKPTQVLRLANLWERRPAQPQLETPQLTVLPDSAIPGQQDQLAQVYLRSSSTIPSFTDLTDPKLTAAKFIAGHYVD